MGKGGRSKKGVHLLIFCSGPIPVWGSVCSSGSPTLSGVSAPTGRMTSGRLRIPAKGGDPPGSDVPRKGDSGLAWSICPRTDCTAEGRYFPRTFAVSCALIFPPSRSTKDTAMPQQPRISPTSGPLRRIILKEESAFPDLVRLGLTKRQRGLS